jgi:hypothetical protein
MASHGGFASTDRHTKRSGYLNRPAQKSKKRRNQMKKHLDARHTTRDSRYVKRRNIYTYILVMLWEENSNRHEGRGVTVTFVNYQKVEIMLGAMNEFEI